MLLFCDRIISYLATFVVNEINARIGEAQSEESEKGHVVVTSKEVVSTLPNYESREEVENDKERIEAAFREKIKEALDRMKEFKDFLFRRGEERRRQMLQDHPEYAAYESATEGRVYARGKSGEFVNDETLLSTENAPELGLKGVWVRGMFHHKPEEEVLAHILKFADYNSGTNSFSKKPFLFSDRNSEFETADEFSKTDFKNAEEFYSYLMWFFSNQIFHNLFRAEYLIEAYYPDNSEYKAFMKPTEELRLMLKKIGIEVQNSPLLEIFDAKNKTNADNYVSDSPWHINYLPTVVKKVNDFVGGIEKLKKLGQSPDVTTTVDIKHVGFKLNKSLVPMELSGALELLPARILYSPDAFDYQLGQLNLEGSKVY